MNQDPEDISRWVKDLISRSTREQIQAMQRFSDLVRRVTSGELDHAQVRGEYVRFFREESTGYMEDLTRLGLSFQNALLELNRKYSDRFFDQVIGSPFNGAPSSEGRADRRKEVSLHLSGVRGEEVVRTFVVENKREEEEIVTFLVSEFSDAQSTVAFRPPLQLHPPRLHLRPREEHIVTLRLPLLAELFKPRQTYFATILAKGHNDVLLTLRVEILESVSGDNGEIAVRDGALRQDKEGAGMSLEWRGQAEDFKRIQGIGDVYSRELKAAQVRSFAQLASLDNSKLRDILGDRGYERAKREKWREQARILSGGKG